MAGRPTLLPLRQEEGPAAQTIPHWPVRYPWLGCVHYLFYFIRNYLVQQQQQLHHQQQQQQKQQQQQRDAEQMPLPPTDAGAAPATAQRCFILPLLDGGSSMGHAASTAGFLLLLSQSFNVAAPGA